VARIRTIKPEFFTSEQIIELRPLTRLLFIGMWPFCDDHGVHVASVKTLKVEIFPADDITLADIEGMVDELIGSRLVVEYSSNGRSYWHVTGWESHQKIEKKSFKHPWPYQENQIVTRESSNGRRMVVERSATESNGMESKGVEPSQSSSLSPVEVVTAEQPKPPESMMMTLDSFRKQFFEATGKHLPGGCNQQAVQICQRFPRDALIQGFARMAEFGGSTLRYLEEVLANRPQPRASPERKTKSELLNEKNRAAATEALRLMKEGRDGSGRAHNIGTA
jgi:hypothetical protein